MANPAPPMLHSAILALLLATSAATPSTSAATTAALDKITRALDDRFEKLSQQTGETLTKLQVYIHAYFDTASPNQTVFEVASADITPQSASHFGWIIAVDNPLTARPDPGSEGMGRYQGMNIYADFTVPAATMDMNIAFDDGSTVTIFGRQPVPEEVRVMSVVGGTGKLRMAKGTVVASTCSVDAAAQTGVYLYVIYVLTPAIGSLQTA